MKTFSTLCRVCFLVLIVCFTGHLHVFAQDADTILQRLKAKYESMDALSARFTQTMRTDYSDEESVLTGTLIMQGDQYRMETEALTVVTNGETNWVLMPEDNQVTISDYEEDETSFSPRQFFVTHPDRYKSTYEGTTNLDGVKHLILLLEPLDPDAFIQSTRLWVRDRDSMITRVALVDLNDTQMLFNLTDIKINPTVDQQTFRLTVPKGAEVIDLRS